MNTDKMLTRLLMGLIGVIIDRIAVGGIQMSNLGVDPFTSFVSNKKVYCEYKFIIYL